MRDNKPRINKLPKAIIQTIIKYLTPFTIVPFVQQYNLKSVTNLAYDLTSFPISWSPNYLTEDILALRIGITTVPNGIITGITIKRTLNPKNLNLNLKQLFIDLKLNPHHIKKLNFYGNYDHLDISFLQNTPNLTHLILSECTIDLTSLKFCLKLEYLDISECSIIGPHILPPLPFLLSLFSPNLKITNILTPSKIKHLVFQTYQLMQRTQIHTHKNYLLIANTDINTVDLSSFKNIRSLTIDSYLSNSLILDLITYKKLITLKIIYHPLEESSENIINNLPIKKLILHGATSFPPNLPDLESLKLISYSKHNLNLSYPKLKKLTLQSCNGIETFANHNTKYIKLINCHILKTIHNLTCDTIEIINGHSLQQITNIQCQSLIIHNCPNLSHLDLTHLQNPHFINLSQCPILYNIIGFSSSTAFYDHMKNTCVIITECPTLFTNEFKYMWDNIVHRVGKLFN